MPVSKIVNETETKVKAKTYANNVFHEITKERINKIEFCWQRAEFYRSIALTGARSWTDPRIQHFLTCAERWEEQAERIGEMSATEFVSYYWMCDSVGRIALMA